jgi:hypothetical protein
MNQMGVRLTCQVCGAQVIVVKGGSGEVHCHARPMLGPSTRPEAKAGRDGLST